MTERDPAVWVAGRTPAPPGELRERLHRTLESSERSGPALHLTLAHAAEEELERARRRSPRDREAAYDLLAADALVTYACEAALELAEPEAALRELIRRCAGS